MLIKNLTRGAIAILLLSTLACGKKDHTIPAKKIVRPAGTSQPQVDTQAQQLGINIDWKSTEVIGEENGRAKLTHVFIVNGQEKTFSNSVALNKTTCANADMMTYDAEMTSKSNESIYTALGSTSCSDSDIQYVGLSFMAWNAQNQLTQNFVLLNITDAKTSMVSKQVISTSYATYLPDWVAQMAFQYESF